MRGESECVDRPADDADELSSRRRSPSSGRSISRRHTRTWCSTHNAYASHTPRIVSIVETRPIVARRSRSVMQRAVLASTRRRSSRCGADDGARSARAARAAPQQRLRAAEAAPGGLAGQQPHRRAVYDPSVLRRPAIDAIPRRPPRLHGRRATSSPRVPAARRAGSSRCERRRRRQTEPLPANGGADVVAASSAVVGSASRSSSSPRWPSRFSQQADSGTWLAVATGPAGDD